MLSVLSIAEDARAAGLLHAQAQAVALFDEVQRRALVAPGVTELQASKAIRSLAAEMLGVRRHWHKRIVRAGINTLEPYSQNPPDRLIGEDDLAFVDLGPVFAEWEADFGRTYVFGDDPVKHRLVTDLPLVFAAGRAYFEADSAITGEQLYAQLCRLATHRGWEFGNYHCGHLVGEFPHVTVDESRTHNLLMAGSFKPMRRPDLRGGRPHWILEVHLVDRERGFGGFYEQLLTL